MYTVEYPVCPKCGNLWRCRYRPSEGEGSAGQLASYKKHLVCKAEKLALKSEISDIFLCVKYGGECKLLKCLKIHNNQESV